MSQFGESPFYQSGGGGGGGGGGYIPSGSPFGGSANGSPGGVTRRAASHSLRPVTIYQLWNATQAHTDAEWVIDTVEVAQVTVVALVKTVQYQTTNIVYNLTDGTGDIEARHWVDSSTADEEESNPNAISNRDVIRVTGTIKQFGTKRYINATHLARCSAHEMDFHELDVCNLKMVIERGPVMPSKSGQPAAQTSTANGHSAYTAQSNSTANDQFSHLPEIERTIIKFMLEQPQNEEGVHVGSIARAVGGNAAAISTALDRLMDEGHVFTTLDESHYAVSV